jgi:CrcB protein
MAIWHKLAWLAAAGAVGTWSRYYLQLFVQQLAGERFPWGTLAVNAIGCFLFGVVWIMWDRGRMTVETRLIVLVGFMGAFTTFSTYAFETVQLLDRGEWWRAAGNLTLESLTGIFCVFAGFGLGKWL